MKLIAAVKILQENDMNLKVIQIRARHGIMSVEIVSINLGHQHHP
jgi:hypothetical protein